MITPFTLKILDGLGELYAVKRGQGPWLDAYGGTFTDEDQAKLNAFVDGEAAADTLPNTHGLGAMRVEVI